MSLDIEQFQKKINEASPLEVPFLLMQLEQYDCESAQDMLERINKDFQKEDMINNVVTPVMTSIVDSLLMLPIFKGFTRKLGLNANRVMLECRTFNYDGQAIYLLPDTFVENYNQENINKKWGIKNRPNYNRTIYENPSEMGRYKKKRVEDAGTVKNLTDEYTGEKIGSKLERIREIMKENGCNAHVLSSLDDIAWLLNIRGNDIAYCPLVLS